MRVSQRRGRRIHSSEGREMVSVMWCCVGVTFGGDAFDAYELSEVVGLQLSRGHLPLTKVPIESDVVVHLVSFGCGQVRCCRRVKADGLLQCRLEGGVVVSGGSQQSTVERLVHPLNVVDVHQQTTPLLLEHPTDAIAVVQLAVIQHITEVPLVSQIRGGALLEQIHHEGGKKSSERMRRKQEERRSTTEQRREKRRRQAKSDHGGGRELFEVEVR